MALMMLCNIISESSSQNIEKIPWHVCKLLGFRVRRLGSHLVGIPTYREKQMISLLLIQKMAGQQLLLRLAYDPKVL